jgi:hypothetical protein
MGAARMEHFVTLLDLAFLPQGLALFESLMKVQAGAVLWIVAMDAETVAALDRLALPGVRVIDVREIETRELLEVKEERTRGEYCWTVTPFTFEAVFDRAPEAARVTYMDADLWLFRSPMEVFSAASAGDWSVLVTDHVFAPEYDRAAEVGRFCVQFLSVVRDQTGLGAAHWWQRRCLEWCSSRIDEGRFGDQRYLDEWPRLLGHSLAVVNRPGIFSAPWNHRWLGRLADSAVFHHFHGFRLLDESRVQWWYGYRLGRDADSLYGEYSRAVGRGLASIRSLGFTPRWLPGDGPRSLREYARACRDLLGGHPSFPRVWRAPR